MKPQHFDLLTQVEKAQYVLYQGVEVASRDYKEFDIHLYQMPGFYVEIFCHKTSGKINALRSFSDMDMLDPYLQDIELDSLLQLIKTSK